MLIQRLSKCVLLGAVAVIYTLIVFNNLTDYNSNWHFVRHVLSMDTTFPGNHAMWRSIADSRLQTAFYISVIAWEALTALLCWWGFARLMASLHAPAIVFMDRKDVAVAALTLGLLLWFTAFLSIGAEWFLMWQSRIWNGQQAAFRMFTCLGLVLLYLTRPDTEL